jgi:hypothetical protein
VWPLLVDYFYRDSITVNEGNALALLSLSRQLLVSSVDAYCLEFIGQHLDTYNCIRYLRKAVKHNISDIQQQCVALAAQGAVGIACVACNATAAGQAGRQQQCCPGQLAASAWHAVPVCILAPRASTKSFTYIMTHCCSSKSVVLCPNKLDFNSMPC